MAWFISNAQNIEDTILNLQRDIGKELREAFPDCVTEEVVSLPEILLTISVKTGHKFLIIIDEWDALFREVQNTPQPGMIADIQSTAEMAKVAEQLKYATIVVSSLPLLIMYPFFQKYFDKGVMVGSVKG